MVVDGARRAIETACSDVFDKIDLAGLCDRRIRD